MYLIKTKRRMSVETRKERRRVFNGVTDTNPSVRRDTPNEKGDLEIRRRAKKHLKAYLKGAEYYFDGKDYNGMPVRYRVSQEFVERDCVIPRNGYRAGRYTRQ